MKRNFLRFLSFATGVVMVATVFTACDNDDDSSQWNDAGSIVDLPSERVFILNEGSYQMNNSGIDFYGPNADASDKDYNFVGDIYSVQNGKSLGDTGQDMIEYEGNMYVSVFGSSLLLKLNSAGVEEARLAFSETDGQPRYMQAVNGKIYVTLYSGKVARIDATTLAIEDYVSVGLNPEHIAYNNDCLYVANSGWGADSTLSVINVNDFKVEKTVNVAVNPCQVLVSDNQVFVMSYGAYYDYPVQSVDIEKGTSTTIANASFMAENNGVLYLVNSVTDWVSNVTSNAFFTYDVASGKLDSVSFLDDETTALLSSAGIYMVEINPVNGDFYIGVSDYVTNGTVYRVNKDGKLIDTIHCGGISPNNVVFLN